MTLYCVFHTDSDEYTYSCDTLIGIFESKGDAETNLLIHIDKMKELNQRLTALNQESSGVLKDLNEKINKLFSGVKKKDGIFRAKRKLNESKENVAKEKKILKEDHRLRELASKELNRIELERRALRPDWSSTCDENLDNYSIRPMETGEIHTL